MCSHLMSHAAVEDEAGTWMDEPDLRGKRLWDEETCTVDLKMLGIPGQERGMDPSCVYREHCFIPSYHFGYG